MTALSPPKERARERLLQLASIVRDVQMRPETALEIEMAATDGIPNDAAYVITEGGNMAVLWDDRSDRTSGWSIVVYTLAHDRIMSVLRPPQTADGTAPTPGGGS
jgi:hypothetical protein